ncbi:putative RNA methyltransferase [Clostridium butyricum]
MKNIDNKILLTCPICGENLQKEFESKVYKCEQNHSYDIAKQGYVNLLISNMKRSKNPGDSKDMVLARVDFLRRGFYKKISDKINEVICEYFKDSKEKIDILDVGCGEGYYLTNLKEAIKINNIEADFYGMDVSKEAVKYASRSEKECLFVVGNNYHIPAKDNSVDCILSVFSPIDIDEINRVLKKDGIFVRVLPRTNHLIELRNIIYSVVNLNEKVYKPDSEKDDYIKEVNVTYDLDLNNEEFTSLLKMTPHYWKSTPENKEKLEEYKDLSITVDMRIGVFRKKK